MEVQQCFSVDELFEKVKDFDKVFTIEASLVDALNSRVEKPFLGTFATTPRRFVLKNSMNEEILGRKELFLETVEKTGLNYKDVANILDKLLSCWRHTGSFGKVLEYGISDKESFEKVLEVVKNTENIYKALEDFDSSDLLSSDEVAVIGHRFFDEADKKILPEKFTKIKLVKEDCNFSLPGFKSFKTKQGLITSLVDSIKSYDPRDVGIVVKKGSSYSELVKSALESENIPVMVGDSVSEDDCLNTFLYMCSLAVSNRQLKVHEIIPVIKKLGRDVPTEIQNDYADKVDECNVKWFLRVLDKLSSSDYELAAGFFDGVCGSNVSEILGRFGFLGKEVSEETLNFLEFFFEEYQINKDAGNGVLISDVDSLVVDRPVMFFIGMDSSWDPVFTEEPWKDVEKELKEAEEKFEILLQNGEIRNYMVVEKELNESVKPSAILGDFLGGLTDFSLLKDSKKCFSGSSSDVKGFVKDKSITCSKESTALSQSALNSFAYCPKDFMFSRLSEYPDQTYFRKGNLLHDFAEFYANYPEKVMERGVNFFIEKMVEEMNSILDDQSLSLAEKEFETGVKNIVDFIDAKEIEENSLTDLDDFDKNFFGKLLDENVDKGITELNFFNNKKSIKGKIDLVVSDTEIVDFKTGRSKTVSSLIKKSNFELLDRKPNFQALMYISQLRQHNPDEVLSFTFLHLLENVSENVKGEKTSWKDGEVNLKYFPGTFNQMLSSEEVKEFLYSSNRRKKLIDLLADDYNTVMDKLTISKEAQYSKKKILEDHLEEFKESCSNFLSIGRGSERLTENQLEKACKSFLKKLVTLRRRVYFKEDVDRFEEMVLEHKKCLNKFYSEGFPVENVLGIEIDFDKIENKDMVYR